MGARGPQATTLQPVELTSDAAFSRRIIRLALVSSIALGLVWLLATVTLDAHPGIGASLALGWLLMPSILFLSLRRPRLRYLLAIPSGLVGVPLLIICASNLPEGPVARAGWLLLTAGILTGGLLGVWLWFRWLPVPGWLHAPFSAGRWALIGLHVGLVVLGLVLVCMSALLRDGVGRIGKLDQAFSLLDRAYQTRSTGLIYLHLDPVSSLYVVIRGTPIWWAGLL